MDKVRQLTADVGSRHLHHSKEGGTYGGSTSTPACTVLPRTSVSGMYVHVCTYIHRSRAGDLLYCDCCIKHRTSVVLDRRVQPQPQPNIPPSNLSNNQIPHRVIPRLLRLRTLGVCLSIRSSLFVPFSALFGDLSTSTKNQTPPPTNPLPLSKTGHPSIQPPPPPLSDTLAKIKIEGNVIHPSPTITHTPMFKLPPAARPC